MGEALSLKKLITDRFEAREDIVSGVVTPTHTEKLMLRPHPAIGRTRSQRKRARKAQKKG